jgi:hypothetical protein
LPVSTRTPPPLAFQICGIPPKPGTPEASPISCFGGNDLPATLTTYFVIGSGVALLVALSNISRINCMRLPFQTVTTMFVAIMNPTFDIVLSYRNYVILASLVPCLVTTVSVLDIIVEWWPRRVAAARRPRWQCIWGVEPLKAGRLVAIIDTDPQASVTD